MLMQMAYVGDNNSNLSSNLGLSVILPESYLDTFPSMAAKGMLLADTPQYMTEERSSQKIRQ